LRLPGTRNLRAIGISAAIAVGTSLGVLAPPALAAPANDLFANRAPIGDALPLALEESNAEATRDGTVEIGNFAAGHSIWWEWEAPRSGWTTVSTCASAPFRTLLGVFEGSDLAHLTTLTKGNSTEGPQCWSGGTTQTFHAEAGHDYDLAADGNGFYPPEAPRPSGEGTVKLTIEPTPPPPDDAFADATPLEGRLFESEGPIGNFYSAQSVGYDWGATTEPGEPAIGSAPGAGSVWYSWTPPVSGEARLHLEGNPTAELAIFAGDSLADLARLPTSEPYPGFLALPVSAGTTYRIGVAALAGPGGEPEMSSFELAASLEHVTIPPPVVREGPTVAPGVAPTGAAPSLQPSLAPPKPAAAPTVVAPAVDPVARTATVRFRSSTPGAQFRCQLDAKPFRGCRSPYVLRGLARGRHRLAVIAAAPGHAASAPVVVHFAVATPRRDRHAAG
jgi:hypothetical protein